MRDFSEVRDDLANLVKDGKGVEFDELMDELNEIVEDREDESYEEGYGIGYDEGYADGDQPEED